MLTLDSKFSLTIDFEHLKDVFIDFQWINIAVERQ
jgi:hypothetical protein